MKIKFLLLVLLTFATLTNSACSKDEAIANSYFDNDSASQTVELLYMGQASLRIVTESGKVIYIDPYAGSDAGYSLPADLILITHEHFDHTAVAYTGYVEIISGDCIKNVIHPITVIQASALIVCISLFSICPNMGALLYG